MMTVGSENTREDALAKESEAKRDEGSLKRPGTAKGG